MKEYIDKQAAIIQLSHNKSRGDDEWMLAVESDMGVIKAIPAADVVPVVRCKECRNSEYDFVTQIRGCSWFRIPVTDDFFCAKGERNEKHE